MSGHFHIAGDKCQDQVESAPAHRRSPELGATIFKRMCEGRSKSSHLGTTRASSTTFLYLVIKMRSYYHFEKNPLAIRNAHIAVPDAPAYGIEIDDARVEARELMRWA